MYEKAVERGMELGFEGLPFGGLFRMKSCKVRKS
nr:ornithine cyclodeaminase [Bacillus thuringiensis]